MRDVAERAFERVTKKQPVYSTHSLTRLPKEVGAMAAVLNGKVDQILLTGGIAYSDYVTSEIKEKVGSSPQSPSIREKTNSSLSPKALFVY